MSIATTQNIISHLHITLESVCVDKWQREPFSSVIVSAWREFLYIRASPYKEERERERKHSALWKIVWVDAQIWVYKICIRGRRPKLVICHSLGCALCCRGQRPPHCLLWENIMATRERDENMQNSLSASSCSLRARSDDKSELEGKVHYRFAFLAFYNSLFLFFWE